MSDVDRDDFDQYAAVIALYVDRLANDGWLHPAAAELLRAERVELEQALMVVIAERDALLDLGDKAREWRAVRFQTATGFPWQDGVRTHNALAAAVDALQPTEEAQP